MDPSLLPAPVPGLTNVVALATSSSFTSALCADVTVLSWGSNLSGVLGRETDVLDNPIPAPVPGQKGDGICCPAASRACLPGTIATPIRSAAASSSPRGRHGETPPSGLE